MTTIGSIEIPTRENVKLHYMFFAYALVAGSSAWFLLLWPLLISAPSVALVADYYLFASQENGLHYRRVESSNSIHLLFLLTSVLNHLSPLCIPARLVHAVQYCMIGNNLMKKMLKWSRLARGVFLGERNIRHKGWENQCISARMSSGYLQQGDMHSFFVLS